jgi:hypothetical protein
VKRTRHHDGCDCLACIKEIDENNHRPIWMPFVPEYPVMFVPDYPQLFIPDYPKPWEPWI